MMRTFLAVLLMGCGSAASTTPPTTTAPISTSPATAKTAPDFTLADSEGQPVTLSKLLASGPVILAFFPKAFTGG